MREPADVFAGREHFAEARFALGPVGFEEVIRDQAHLVEHARAVTRYDFGVGDTGEADLTAFAHLFAKIPQFDLPGAGNFRIKTGRSISVETWEGPFAPILCVVAADRGTKAPPTFQIQIRAMPFFVAPEEGRGSICQRIETSRQA